MHKEPKHTTIAGLSLGGLAAFYAALQNPYIFGNVLSLSGSVHWKKEGYENNIPWMENQIASVNSNANHVQFYMAAGQLENEPLLKVNRHLYGALKEKGYKPLMKSFKVVMIAFGGVKSYLMD